ncbi:MAG TPA: phage minor head protein [Armatimonadota bacterium]|nr:phage minor head protein [Armatimonadota bacterium]
MDAEPAGGEAVIHPGPPLARLCDWILAFSARTARGCAEKIRKALLESLAAGRSVYETRVEMEAVHAGLSQYQSEWIARTEGVRAYAEGQVAALAEVGAERVPWLATGDERTCPTCGPRDGVTYDINERPLLPLHPNCRCTRTAAARGSCRMMSWTGCGRNWCEQSRLAPRTPAWHAGRQNPPGSNSGKPLRELTLGDLQSFADTLG